jgi:hypothetical protein
MKIYPIMPFDAFNGSLVEHCLVSVADLKLVICSHNQGTRRAKSPNIGHQGVNGLTGDKHLSDRCRPCGSGGG